MTGDSNVIPLVDEGLGNSTYLVDLGDGRALVVDPSRDLRPVHTAARERSLRPAFVAETHLHADFVSGARQLGAEGARIIASAAGQRDFPHVGLDDGDEFDVGGFTLRALLTPGHTLEHVSYLLLDGDRPLGVFTGGSLIAGTAARTDLVDPDRTRELAYSQYDSLRKLTTLPDHTAVWPTHGAGSFCSAPSGGRRTTTIAEQKASNPLLDSPDADAFADQLIASLGSFPPYFLELAEVNRRGPAVLDTSPALPSLSPDRVRSLVKDGVVVIDVRPVSEFGAAHIPGAISIPLRPQFASWLGWLVDLDAPIVLVRGEDQDGSEVAWQAAKIGHENVLGELHGGMPAWRASGGRTATLAVLEPHQIGSTPILDVRQEAEFNAGHLPGSEHIELGELPKHDLEPGDRVVVCGHGERAATGASMLSRAGMTGVSILIGGPAEVAEATGTKLELSG